MSFINACKGCIEKQNEIDKLEAEAGRLRREFRMKSIIYEIKRRGIDPVKRIKYALDELSIDRDKDPYELL